MSLWWCANCHSMCGPDPTYRCPKCGSIVSYATIDSAKYPTEGNSSGYVGQAIGADPHAGATGSGSAGIDPNVIWTAPGPIGQGSASWDPKCLETLCYCRTLWAEGLPANQYCEPCVRRHLAAIYQVLRVTDQKSALRTLTELTDQLDEF